jgi:small-conductance mechanosensitive channel
MADLGIPTELLPTAISPFSSNGQNVSETNVQPNTHFKLFNHIFLDVSATGFLLFWIIIVATLILAQIIPDGLEFFFKRILRIHLDFNPRTMLIKMLHVEKNLTTGNAKKIVSEYIGEEEEEEEGKESKSSSYNKLLFYSTTRAHKILYFRTNMMIIIYLFLRCVILFLGLMAAFYFLRIDFIYWIGGVGIVSLVAVYGFADYIRNFLAHVFILYTDALRVGDSIELPLYQTKGCVLHLGIFHVKILSLNEKVLGRLLNKNQKENDSNSFHTSSKAKPAINTNFNSNTSNGFPIMLGDSNYGLGIVYPTVNNSANIAIQTAQKQPHRQHHHHRHIRHEETTLNIIDDETHTTKNGDRKSFEKLMLEVYIPNTLFWTSPYQKSFV